MESRRKKLSFDTKYVKGFSRRRDDHLCENYRHIGSLSFCCKRACFGFNKILRIGSYRSAKMSNGFFNLLVKIVCFLIFEISNRFAKIFDNSYALRLVSASICIQLLTIVQGLLTAGVRISAFF